MMIVKVGIAGTLESSDIMIRVYPGGNGLQIEVESLVYRQFGKHITKLIETTARELGVENAIIEARDFGALDCTICARLETALKRAGKEAAV